MSVGYDGYSWSSAVSGSHGVYLGFNVTLLYLGYANSRGFGIQLRCLSE